MTREAHRLFCSEYSAVNQNRAMSRAGGFDEFIGQLRFDSLLTETIVIPDSHIFDGAFFARISPDRLRNLIGRGAHDRDLPILVKSRRPTLRQSLAQFLERQDSQLLNPFPFNLIASENVRSELALELASTDAHDLHRRLRTAEVAPAVAGLLRDALRKRDIEADEEIETLEAGWSRWIEAEERGTVRVEPWDRPFQLKEAMAVDRIDVDNELNSALGRELYERLHTMRYRSNATRLLTDAAQTAGTGAEALDVQTLSGWYTDARHRAFARQHGCAFARSVESQGPPVGPVRKALESVAVGDCDRQESDLVTLPPEFAYQLTALSGEEFGGLTRELSLDLRNWWRTTSPEALERIVRQVDVRCKPRADASSDRSALAQLFAKVTAQTAVFATQGWKWGVFATLVSEALLAMREQKRQSPTQQVRRRVVEYGLDRIGQSD
jgi:hypothetical protein